jgi:hypothetical protein
LFGVIRKVKMQRQSYRNSFMRSSGMGQQLEGNLGFREFFKIGAIRPYFRIIVIETVKNDIGERELMSGGSP